jgi:nucleoid DNA-binding protein
MKGEFAELVGHDNPLGHYPAPVVPIVRLRGFLMAIYARDSGSDVVRLNRAARFIHHDNSLKTDLNKFDYLSHRLFAMSESLLEFYPIRSEARYFRDLLNRQSTRDQSPFFRLSIAKGTKLPQFVVQEMILCLNDLRRGPEGFVDLWYISQRQDMLENSDFLELTLPTNWRELLPEYKVDGSSRLLSVPLNRYPVRKKPPPMYLTNAPKGQWAQVARVAGTRAKIDKRGLIKSEVVKRLAKNCNVSQSQVRSLLAELVNLAIRELKANGQFPFPGLGTLVLSRSSVGIRSNPTTGEGSKRPSGKILEFQISKRLKDSVGVERSSKC